MSNLTYPITYNQLIDEIENAVAETKAAQDAEQYIARTKESKFTKTESQLVDESNEKNRVSHKKVFTILGEATFWVLVAAIIAVFAIRGANGDNGRQVLGYSLYNVLTGSMQREIPQGSLVLVHNLDTNEIQVGDDITFITSTNDIITHRVITIYENYLESGMRGFQTQGLENPSPDSEIVYADNVLGKVVWHASGLGSALNYLSNHWLWITVLGIGVLTFLFLLKYIIKGAANKPKETTTVSAEIHA